MTDGQNGAVVIDALAVKELIPTKLNLIAVNTTATIEVANSNTNITISNVGAAGIGTATIKGWLQFTGSDGVVNYIPYWS